MLEAAFDNADKARRVGWQAEQDAIKVLNTARAQLDQAILEEAVPF